MAENNTTSIPAEPTWIAERIGGLLDDVNRYLHADLFNRIINSATVTGHFLALAVLGLLIQLVATFVISGSQFLWGLGWLIMLPLLQYTAVQFLGASRSLVLSNTTTLGSQAFLRSYALIALVAALVAFVGGTALAFQFGSVAPFLSGLAATVLWLATAWLALNPDLLGIRVSEQSSAGEEAIGILSFFIKSAVRIVPLFYGVALTVGAIQAVVLLLSMIGASRPEIAGSIMGAQGMAFGLVLVIIAPFLAYIAFVVYFLVIDLMRSILSIPRSFSGGKGDLSAPVSPATTGTSGKTKKKKKKKKTASKPSSG
jgi:hypothetical protein